MKTIAQQVSKIFGDDGQKWETTDGKSFIEVCEEHGADITYSARDYDADGDMVYVDGYKSGHLAGDPIRYEFPDGSALVEAGDGWDEEGKIRFSWAG